MTLPTSYAQEFVNKVDQGVPLQNALSASLIAETELRRLFATDRGNSILNDSFIGLIDVYAASDSLRRVQARKIVDDADMDSKYVFPLKSDQRRSTGEYAMAPGLDQFRTSWNVFTEGALSQLTDWNNVVAAGGAVLASLQSLPEHARGSKRAIRKYFHDEAYSTSDIDLFLYGLTPEQAEKKAIQIYEAVRDSVPWDTVCVRTKHAISIHSQYPYRPVQIILRLYKSPAEILAGFDIDCACYLYDGARVWGNPRAIAALMGQSNLVDMTRRSPSYEVRLAKYAIRGFEVHVPNLVRPDVDPTIFERSINRIEGLARLLVLEKLSDPNDRTRYLEKRRELRGRPQTQGYSRRAMRRRRKVKGDLKAAAEMFGGLNPSDYGTQSFHIPYGPGFDAKKLEKFIYGTDLGMNSTFNPKNKDRRLHRHPAFFGTMGEVIEDCCEYCPDPISMEEKELQAEEDKVYIRGRVEFMEEDPGRQMMTGSFNPIDEGEWSAQAYLGDVEKLFGAIANEDLETVRDIVEQGFDLRRRDHVGRTSLHLALLSKSRIISSYLIDADARITARLVDGRTSLHLAAQLGMDDIVSKLLERSKLNEIKAEEEKAAAEAKKKLDNDGDSQMEDGDQEDEDIRASSEDDWDSDEEAAKRRRKKVKEEAKPSKQAEDPQSEGAAIPEDNEELPDILDINVPDWDHMYSPLSHAIVAGHLPVVDVLLRAGADAQTPFKKGEYYNAITVYPLTLTLLTEDEEAACAIAARLLESGASCTATDSSLKTIFHQAVIAGAVSLVRTFLQVDPNARTAMDFLPQIGSQTAVSPLVSAISSNNRAMAALLLSFGAKSDITEEMFDKAWDARYRSQNTYTYIPQKQPNQWLQETIFPIEAALSQRSDLVLPLLKLGVDLNRGLKSEWSDYSRKDSLTKLTILDRIRACIQYSKKELDALDRADLEVATLRKLTVLPHTTWGTSSTTFIECLTVQYKQDIPKVLETAKTTAIPELAEDKVKGVQNLLIEAIHTTASRQLKWYTEIEALVVRNGGKSVRDLHPKVTETQVENWSYTHTPQPYNPMRPFGTSELPLPDSSVIPVEYKIYRSSYQSETVSSHLRENYAKLFEACWRGDNQTIEKLCLPPKGGKHDKHATYLQVVADIVPDARLQQIYNSAGYYPALGVGLSTLAVSVMARKWDTAKVIISIAKAQYEKPDEPHANFKPFDSDGSDEEYDSDMSEDGYPEITKPILMDLANRMSTIKTNVGPEQFFSSSVVFTENLLETGTLISQILKRGDLNDLERLLELGALCEPPQTLQPTDLATILQHDNPELLEFIIRTFGYGIHSDQQEDEDQPGDTEAVEKSVIGRPKSSKTYLGLNVNGKKRKDLASKGDPDAPRAIQSSTIPLIWQAAQMNATKCLAWLSGPGPLKAYTEYMTTSKDEHASSLKRMKDFEQRLPCLLGATPNQLGEHVVFAHLNGRMVKKETLENLFDIFATDKTVFIHKKLEGLEVTPLLYICGQNFNKDIFDFFFERGADVLNSTYDRCNMLHVMAQRGYIDLMKHVFARLSQDQLSTLLSQTTRRKSNTPLMIAVKTGHLQLVELLLSFHHPVTDASLLIRDTNGSLPIHEATSKGYHKIAELLLQSKSAQVIKALFTENGIGSTPLEIATFKHLLDFDRELQSRINRNIAVPYTVPPPVVACLHGSWPNARNLLEALKQTFDQLPQINRVDIDEYRALENIVVSLDEEGRLTNLPNLQQVLKEYVERTSIALEDSNMASSQRKQLDDELKALYSSAESNTSVQYPVSNVMPLGFGFGQFPSNNFAVNSFFGGRLYTNQIQGQGTATQDVKATYEVVRKAVESSGLKRRRGLVHLLDAQTAVNSAMNVATNGPTRDPRFTFGQTQGYLGLFRRSRINFAKMDSLGPEEDQSNTFNYILNYSSMMNIDVN